MSIFEYDKELHMRQEREAALTVIEAHPDADAMKIYDFWKKD